MLDDELLLEVAVAAWTLGTDPGCLSGKREQQRREDEDTAGVERGWRLDRRSRDQRTSPRRERDWDHVGDLAEAVGQPAFDPTANATAIPAEIKDEREEDRRGDQEEPDDVVMALLQALDQIAWVSSRRPTAIGPSRRALTRA